VIGVGIQGSRLEISLRVKATRCPHTCMHYIVSFRKYHAIIVHVLARVQSSVNTYIQM
jgi:hypothetical protein